MEKLSTEDRSSFRQVVKATSVFGGVQVYQIIIGIVKSKFIAVLLGPTGVGIQGLFTTATDLIKNITSLGLSQSAVKDVAEANSTNDIEKISATSTVVRKLVWITGLVGLLGVLVLSPFLSKYTFGNYDYTIPFMLLSVTLLLDQLSSGERVLLQGLRKIKYLAKATAIGSTLGLLISIPLYYLMGIKGIVPTLILCSLTELIICWVYAHKIKIPKADIGTKETFRHGMGMLQMGAAMCTNAVLATLSAYVLKSFINLHGGTADVGFYQAAFILTTTYANLVTNAIATDYYPRLTAVNKDNIESQKIVSKQGEIAVLILSPLLCILILFAPIFVKILYTDEFLTITAFIMVASIGLMLRLGSWLLTYLLLAKGESKLFLICEVIAKVVTLGLNFAGYYYGGMLGLGIAFTISFAFYFVLLNLVAVKRYSFKWSKEFLDLLVLHLALLIGVLLACVFIDSYLKYICGGLIMLASVVFSLYGLEYRIGLLGFIKSKKGHKEDE